MKVSVVVRSFRRIPYMIELVNALLEQDYPDFEVVIIEQSHESRNQHRHDLEKLCRHSRVQLHCYEPLGPAKARNLGVAHSQGDIVLFIDDDDLPLHSDWISAHAENYRDVNCVAVTGREVHTVDEDPKPHNTRRNYRLCLRYSWLKMPRARVRHTKRIAGVTALQGANTSIRKSAIERAGGWDEDVHGHEENSFDFKWMRIRKPEEYYVFDPRAVILRRMDIPGGLARRSARFSRLLIYEFDYVHRILFRYFPYRVCLLYPVYVVNVFYRSREAYGQKRRGKSIDCG